MIVLVGAFAARFQIEKPINCYKHVGPLYKVVFSDRNHGEYDIYIPDEHSFEIEVDDFLVDMNFILTMAKISIAEEYGPFFINEQGLTGKAFRYFSDIDHAFECLYVARSTSFYWLFKRVLEIFTEEEAAGLLAYTIQTASAFLDSEEVVIWERHFVMVLLESAAAAFSQQYSEMCAQLFDLRERVRGYFIDMYPYVKAVFGELVNRVPIAQPVTLTINHGTYMQAVNNLFTLLLPEDEDHRRTGDWQLSCVEGTYTWDYKLHQ